MNLALDRYADNPIIDELVRWPPRAHKIKRLRACFPMFRKPFIEIELTQADTLVRHFARASFAEYWAQTCVILSAITAIELVSEFAFEAYRDSRKLTREVLKARLECIEESNLMFEHGMFEQFLYQYGEDCCNLPAPVLERISTARQALKCD